SPAWGESMRRSSLSLSWGRCAASAPLAPAGLAILLGVGLGGLLLPLARRRGRGVGELGFAGRRIEAELFHAGREVFRQLSDDIEHAAAVALGRVDDQTAGVEMHLAADRAGQERVRPAIFAVADDRVADCRHMDAE